eukprot:6820280-Prymnesium_polylepis.2
MRPTGSSLPAAAARGSAPFSTPEAASVGRAPRVLPDQRRRCRPCHRPQGRPCGWPPKPVLRRFPQSCGVVLHQQHSVSRIRLQHTVQVLRMSVACTLHRQRIVPRPTFGKPRSPQETPRMSRRRMRVLLQSTSRQCCVVPNRRISSPVRTARGTADL